MTLILKLIVKEPIMDSSGFEPEASGALDVSQELETPFLLLQDRRSTRLSYEPEKKM